MSRLCESKSRFNPKDTWPAMKQLRYLLPVIWVWLLASCSVDKYVTPTDRILRHSHFEVEMPDGGIPPKEITDALAGMKNYEVQSPNKSILGIYRFKMREYCLANPNSEGWISRYLRREGEVPVVFDPNAAIRTAQQLQSLLETKGCFNSVVEFDTLNGKNHDMDITYRLKPSPRFRIDQVRYRCESSDVTKLLQDKKDESALKVGDYYDQNNIASERERITKNLRNEGYYYLTKDNIIFLIDTTYKDGALSIEIDVRNPKIRTENNTLKDVPFQKYRIDKIYFYPNGNPSQGVDTLIYPYTLNNRTTNYFFLNPEEMTLNPRVVARSMFLFHNLLYRDRNVERTYNSLINLRNFKYIDIEFTPSPNSTVDSAKLDAHVKFIPGNKQRISLSMEVNNSSPYGSSLQTGLNSGNFGLETVLSYQNKNLFGGAELLNIEGSFLIEMPKLFLTDRESNSISAFESGVNMTLDLPTLLVPFNGDVFWQRSKPHTVFGLGINYQDREYFERLLANISFGYNWSERSNVKHQLLPIELTFARFYDIDPNFWDRIQSIANNGRLKYQYSSHFIFDARYDYLYTNQQFGSRKDFTSFNMTIETAGNLVEGLHRLVGGPSDTNGVGLVYGVPYSQYVRFNSELKHYFYHGQKGWFVTRLLLGVGLPYGNSSQMQMPYEKSFFGGGPTTMRAWHLRRLGPGLYHHDGNTIFERTGDMTLVLNLEERYHLFGIFEGALFVDIGNVWLIYNNNELAGGRFSFKDFLPSLAVGTGLGLRANISILTLRLDVGLPVYDPGYESEQRFRLLRWHSYPWNIRKSQFGPITFNIGIDYPF